MEKVEYKKVKELLDGMVSLAAKCKDGQTAELDAKLIMNFGKGKSDTTFSSITVEGYTMTCDGETEQFANFDKLCARLEELGAADGKHIFITKCGDYNSVAQFEAKGEFDTLDMAGVLDFYPEADEFELVDTDPVPEKMSDEQVENLQNECRAIAERETRRAYEALSAKKRAALPPFEQLWQEIGEEVKAHLKKVKYRRLKKGASPFICDHVGEDTKYSEPLELFWNAYQSYEQAERQCEQAESFKEAAGEDKIFEDKKYAPLLPHLLSSRMTFGWHCTRGPLAKVHRFKLNDDTKKWLKQYQSDYDLEKLQDLALYCGERLLYSSCTHEVFRNDCRDKR